MNTIDNYFKLFECTKNTFERAVEAHLEYPCEASKSFVLRSKDDMNEKFNLLKNVIDTKMEERDNLNSKVSKSLDDIKTRNYDFMLDQYNKGNRFVSKEYLEKFKK